MSTLTVPCDKSTAQAVGSAITYARRYALAAICGVAPEDDDGNAASGSHHEAAKGPPAQKPAQRPAQGGGAVERMERYLERIKTAKSRAELDLVFEDAKEDRVIADGDFEMVRSECGARAAELKAAAAKAFAPKTNGTQPAREPGK